MRARSRTKEAGKRGRPITERAKVKVMKYWINFVTPMKILLSLIEARARGSRVTFRPPNRIFNARKMVKETW